MFETGTHCRWMKREVESLGMKAIVANPSKLRMVTESNTKNDRNDAKKRALVAVARCLVVTAVALLKKPDTDYMPLSERARLEFEAMRSAETAA